MLFQSIFYCLACFIFCYIAFVYTKLLCLLEDENSILRNPIYVSLDEEDFNCLVRGGLLKIADFRNNRSFMINVILKDIGFAQMGSALDKAESGQDIHKGLNKIIG